MNKNALIPGYYSWSMMKQRCMNPKHTDYKYYGEKGITVCNEWLKFSGFYSDMGERPEGLTLDRIDNSKGYSKDNCRWATKLEQTLNRGDNRNNTSGCRGVSKKDNKWRAYVMVNYKQINLGTFTNKRDAIKARRVYEAINYHTGPRPT